MRGSRWRCPQADATGEGAQRQSVISHQSSAISHPSSVISYPSSVISHQAHLASQEHLGRQPYVRRRLHVHVELRGRIAHVTQSESKRAFAHAPCPARRASAVDGSRAISCDLARLVSDRELVQSAADAQYGARSRGLISSSEIGAQGRRERLLHAQDGARARDLVGIGLRHAVGQRERRKGAREWRPRPPREQPRPHVPVGRCAGAVVSTCMLGARAAV